MARLIGARTTLCACPAAFDRLQGEIFLAKAIQVVDLVIVLVVVAFLVDHQLLEQLFRDGIRIGAALIRPLVVILGALLLQTTILPDAIDRGLSKEVESFPGTTCDRRAGRNILA